MLQTLLMFLNYHIKTAHKCKTYTMVVILFESQLCQATFIHFPCCQTKLRSPLPYRFALDIFSEPKFQFQQCFSDLDTNTKEISSFKVHLSLRIEDFPNNLQLFNLRYGMLKVNYQKTVTEFYKCFPNKDYGHLK